MSDTNPEKIIQAVDVYYTAAIEDDIYNYRIAQPFLQEFGTDFMYVGLAYIINGLHRKLASQPPAFNPLMEEMADQELIAYGLTLMNSYQSLIMAYDRMTENGGIKFIQSLLLAASIEDIISLAAFNVASQYCIRDSNIRFLKLAYENAYGTACKVALAYSLDQNGFPDYYDELKPQMQHYLKENINTGVVDDFSTVVVWDLICMDIASDGRASMYFAGWKRK